MKYIIFLGLILLSTDIYAQHSDKCAYDRLLNSVSTHHPDIARDVDSIKTGMSDVVRSMSKTTQFEEYVIPVVFHIVLNSAQLNRIGNDFGIRRRVDSQLIVLNRDIQGLNADSINIPGAFKSLFGKANIRFELAHTTPDGDSTPGYEIINTNVNGFEVEGQYGSGFGFSASKYPEAGGAASWDPNSYLNIWVINPLENGQPTNIVGLALPPFLTNSTSGISIVERGLMLHYGAFGKKTGVVDFYIRGSEDGKTLTHEVGHYFGMFHIWGDDDGQCPDNGGDDDGISDTPPQAYPSGDCPVYPKYDACTRDGNGIMFMNYMDYVPDNCAVMFTKEQVQVMESRLQPGAESYTLTQHPWLLSYPAANTTRDNNYTIYPNPADNVINIVFRLPSQNLKFMRIIDMMGRIIDVQEYELQTAYYSFHTGRLQAGLYFIQMEFAGETDVQKILVR